MVRVIDKIEDLQAVIEDIETVYSNHVSFNFYSPAYAINAYKGFLNSSQNKLFFILVLNNNKITGYIPLYIDEKKTLRFIFDRHTDYCGSVGTGFNNINLKRFSSLVLERKDIRKIDLDNLSPADPLLNVLPSLLGKGINISVYNNHSYLTTIRGKDYFSLLKSKERSELQRIQNKNKEFKTQLFKYPSEFPHDQIVNLRDRMIAEGSRCKNFFGSDFIHFCMQMYDANEMDLYAKWDAERSRIISIVFIVSNRRQNSGTFWITLYENKQYINISTYIDYIKEIEETESMKISFGRGDYYFKSTFNPVNENLYNLRYSKNKLDFFFTNYYGIKLFVKRIVKGQ